MYREVKQILDSELNCDVLLQVPKDSSLGHFATPIALMRAKQEKKSPETIANEIIKKLESNPIFKNLSQKNGFINMKLSDEFLSQNIKKNLENPDNFARDKNSEKILLEFVSANPTGPLHIGHARGAIFGDILARVGNHLGYEIKREYYINDAGSQIDLLGRSIYIAGRENLTLEVKKPELFYRGEYINIIAQEAQEAFGKNIFESALDSKNIKTLAQFGLKKVMEEIIETLNLARVKFDSFVSEDSLKGEFAKVLNKLKENDAVYELDSKLWLKSSQKGDQKDRVIIRDSGEPTYLAGDIIYHHHKFLQHFDKYINIWGADHHGYIARIKASAEFLGFDSKKLEVILSQMVSLLKNGEPFKMSKRAGNVILMRDVMNEIGVDEMRFMFIYKKADTHLEFDIDMFKAQDSNNPIYYINYANARIHTLIAKSKSESSFDISECEEEWKDLLFYAFLLPKILDSAFNERALQQLPEYLKNLSAKLHFCYNSFRILGSKNEGAIIGILKMVSLSITTGLKLMGISAKTTMTRE